MNCSGCGSPIEDGTCYTAKQLGHCAGVDPTDKDKREAFIQAEISSALERNIDFGHNPRQSVKENLEDLGRNNKAVEAQEEFHPLVYHYVENTDLNDSEISRITGIDRRTIGKLKTQSSKPATLDHFGRVRKGAENDRVNSEILRLYGEGLTYLEVAEQVGLSWQSVRARLSKQFSQHMEKKRDDVAGRQYADLEIIRNELLEIIINTDKDSFDSADATEMLADGRVSDLIEMVEKKAKKSQDSRFKAIELLLKTMEREGKLFGVDQNSVTVNHNIRVEPEAIELMQRLKKREVSDAIEAEVIENYEVMGELE